MRMGCRCWPVPTWLRKQYRKLAIARTAVRLREARPSLRFLRLGCSAVGRENLGIEHLGPGLP